MTLEIRLAFDNLAAVLAKAGCGFDDVVDLTLFLLDPNDSVGFAPDALRTDFPTEPEPNVTAVGVTWLAGFAFEVKVFARVQRQAE